MSLSSGNIAMIYGKCGYGIWGLGVSFYPVSTGILLQY